MLIFKEIIKILNANQSPATLPSEIEKYVKTIKPVTTLTQIFITMRNDQTGQDLLATFLEEKIDAKLVHLFLALLDRSKINEFIPIFEQNIHHAIRLQQFDFCETLLRFAGLDAINPEKFKPTILEFGTFKFINSVFTDNLDFSSEENLLALVKNKHDLAYLIQQFPREMLLNTVDRVGNNLLHISLQHQNKNIFLYVLNHGGTALLYSKNRADKTPIDVVYADIAETAQRQGKPFDFGFLMLLEQVGADLETHEYAHVLQAYKQIPEYHHKFLLAKQVRVDREIHAVSFNGGGAKGAAFMAAFKEALDRRLLNANLIKEFAGTSAGAITAAVFAMGFDIDRSTKELEAFDFSEMMKYTVTEQIKYVKDNHIKRWVEHYQNGAYYSLISDLVTSLASESLPSWMSKAPVLTALGQLANEQTGIFDPIYLFKTLCRLIAERIALKDNLKNINPAYITFKDLKENPDIFKQLTVYITNLTEEKTEKCSYETTPNMSVVDAVLHSASYPIFFTATSKHEIVTNEQGVRERKQILVNGKPVICCDGGVLKNDPVDAFDRGEYNEHTLTFLLVSPDGKKQIESQAEASYVEVKSTVHVLGQLYKLMRGTERKTILSDIRNLARILPIDTQGVGTLDFNNAKTNNPKLALAGQDAVIDYLNRRTVSQYASLRQEMVSLLMCYGIAKLSMQGEGQVVEIHPNIRLSALQILRIYAAANDEEVPVLRSMVNPNQRDENGITAMTIAEKFQFAETKKRLHLAGSRPALVRDEFDVFPAFLNRGEAYLKTTLSDADLQRMSDLESSNERKSQKIAEQAAVIAALQLQLAAQARAISELTNSRYKAIRESQKFRTMIQQLENEKQIMQMELDAKLAVEMLGQEEKPIEDKQISASSEGSLSLLSCEIAWISEIINELKRELNLSAAHIIASADKKYSSFFFKHRDALAVCDELIMEEKSQLQNANAPSAAAASY